MKKAFTLIEILISVVLLGLISMFVSSTIYQTKSNNKFFEKKVKADSKVEMLTDILYRDIFQSLDINTTNSKKYTVLNLRSKNSIYGIEDPYITWLVLKQDNTLVRFESAKKITLPIREEQKNVIFADMAIQKCEHFNINLSKDKKDILSFIKIKNQNPIIFEVKKL